MIANNQDLDQFEVPVIDVLSVVDFQTVVGFFQQGLPENPADLVRVELTLDELSTPTDAARFDAANAIDADFSEILPAGVDASVAIDHSQLSGRIVFGFDTSDRSFLYPDSTGRRQ